MKKFELQEECPHCHGHKTTASFSYNAGLGCFCFDCGHVWEKPCMTDSNNSGGMDEAKIEKLANDLACRAIDYAAHEIDLELLTTELRACLKACYSDGIDYQKKRTPAPDEQDARSASLVALVKAARAVIRGMFEGSDSEQGHALVELQAALAPFQREDK